MTEPAHYKRGPSGAAQWLICTDAPEAQAPYPDETGKAADEGTAAHWLLEQCLNSGNDAQVYVDNMPAAVVPAGEETGCLWDWPITGEMVESVQLAIDTVKPDLGKKGTRAFFEERVYLGDHLNLQETIGGTADILIYLPRSKILKVWDFKYGKGHLVGAEWEAEVLDNGQIKQAKDIAGFDFNPQGAIYAAAAINDLERLLGEKREVKEVQVGIIQPRIKHKKGFVRTMKLGMFSIDMVELAVMDADRNRGIRRAGDHCLFCRAKGDCDQYAELQSFQATKGFTAEDQHAPATTAVADAASPAHTLPAKDLGSLISRPVKGLTLQELGVANAGISAIKKWIAAVEKETLARLEHDLKVPGKRLAPGRGKRAYGGDRDELLQAARTTALLGFADVDDLIVPESVLSPAKLEEKLGRSVFADTPLAKLVTYVAAKKPVVVDEDSDAPDWVKDDAFEAEEAPEINSSLL